MAHGIYDTKSEAQRALKNLEKLSPSIKGRRKIVARYIIVDK